MYNLSDHRQFVFMVRSCYIDLIVYLFSLFLCFSLRNISFCYIGMNQQNRFYGHLPGASSVQLPHNNDLADVHEALRNQEQSITYVKDQLDQVLAFMEATSRYTCFVCTVFVACCSVRSCR